ncbi:hypothetical protein [Endomicrobium proavitum]|uniref:RNA polymerase sigma factor 70 region 4 type 2 domain-containing protein n=1 Tax=Endomicrobium proavitum TaxID=1408281 RepID=A0A0G3WHJ5_9BACT|nr:hypothetical protein [Endomicrobium proavitum]AKL98101.1 hypothetical protein Epro_0722 [Endomicrobium proavitum]
MKQIKQNKNDIHSLALSLVYDDKKAKKLTKKTFKKVSKRLFSDERQLKLALYKRLLKYVGRFSVKKKKCLGSDFICLAKKNFKIFDKKVFVLKYEHGFNIEDISEVLNAKESEIKKSLFYTTEKIAAVLEEKNEMP